MGVSEGGRVVSRVPFPDSSARWFWWESASERPQRSRKQKQAAVVRPLEAAGPAGTWALWPAALSVVQGFSSQGTWAPAS